MMDSVSSFRRAVVSPMDAVACRVLAQGVLIMAAAASPLILSPSPFKLAASMLRMSLMNSPQPH
jgi:hypothetical protein